MKGRARADIEDRAADYHRWRQGWGGGYYASDIDCVEWRIVEGQVVPVKVLELTRLDGDRTPLPPAYLEAIKRRFHERDGQAKSIVHLAWMLRVKAIVVLYRYDLTEFWLHDLGKPSGQWVHADEASYRRWLEALPIKRSE